MKKIIVLATLLLATGSILAQSPQGTKINYDESCPATITANTTEEGPNHAPTTRTVNDSKSYDARTTVTDRQGNQSSYTTPAQSKSASDGGQHYKNDTSLRNANNSNVSQIDVDCSPVEK
jgi:hypothetical protein